MPLFTERLGRSATIAGLAAFGAHLLARLLPHTFYAFNLTQSTVAILALAAVAVMVVAHHRSEGQLLTQTQEEMALIGTFGLFWFAFLVALQAFNQGDTEFGTGIQGAASTGSWGSGRPTPCSGNSQYCVVEEWDWY